LYADVWRVSITTGIYESPNEDGVNEKDAVNTNNNANDNEGRNFVSQKKRSLKYQVAPWAPTDELFVVVYGDRGKTGMLPLISDQPGDRAKFLPGCEDNFKVNIG